MFLNVLKKFPKFKKKLRDTIGQIPKRSPKNSKEGPKNSKESLKISKENSKNSKEN